MDKKRKEKLLTQYYFNPKNAAAFSGPYKVFRVLDKRYPGKFSLNFIKRWLNSQDSYSLQKQIRHRFKTANVRVTYIGEQFDVDLMSVINLAKENDGIHYLLFAIDIFSRKLWVKPLKNKTAKVVLTAMREILAEQKPIKIRSDKGSEFNNQWFKKYMKDNDIYYFTTQNPAKANFIERCQRTIRTYLYRMMRQKGSYRYIDDLDNIIANYNSTPHRGLNYISPNDVNKDNEADLWAFMYLKKPKNMPKRKPEFHFRVGDLVRISFVKQPFRRAYQDQYTTEVFKVSGRLLKQGIPMYKLVDLKSDHIKGLFYTSELQRVDKDENTSLWFIETILKKRKKNKKLQYYVKWEGFDDRFNSWIDAADVKDARNSR